MKMLLISDLHIGDQPINYYTQRINSLCEYIRSSICEQLLICVLGDIINNGETENFTLADQVFQCLISELQGCDYKLVFVPGNHDYCNGSRTEFDEFVARYQEAPGFRSGSRVETIRIEEVNVILWDSVDNGNYGEPGCIDLDLLREAIRHNCQNILLMHHSLLFESAGTHDGVLNQAAVLQELPKLGIEFVFHGHTHAARNFNLDGKVKLIGAGAFSKDVSEDLDNSNHQFNVVSISASYLECVTNWRYYGDRKKYMDSLIYPSAPPYADPNTIPKIPVEQPAEYMPRKVLARVFAEGDEWTRSFHRDKAIALLDTLQYRRILLISDAGMGKTTELKQLAVALDQDNKYKRPVPIYLAYYNGGPVEGLLPQSYITLNPESLIYILDGYDEISEDRRTEFKKNLKQFLIKYSETQVLISMRSTFVPTTAELFSDFQCFHLMALEKDDVHCYLEQRGIDVPLFIRETRQKGLEKLLTIPFYLNVIVTIYSSKRSLPTQANLIEQLIQVTVRADNSKFEYSRSRTLSEEEHELIVALTRLAYGIQLLKKNYLSQEEYQTLLPAEKRRLAELSGVWRIQGDQYTFSHNNFREYLTAKHLATLPLPALLERIALTDGSAIERSYLQAWFTQLLDTLDLTTAVTEEEDYISPSWDLLYLLILWKQCKFACPESFYLGLLSVPVSFILESYQLEEKCALIEKMVPLKRIRERISANLQRPLQPTVLDEHFYYCKQYQMHDAKDLAIGLCKDTQRAGHKKREAAGYLYKVFGQELILNEILANADEELLLTLSSLLNDEWDERLEAAIVRQLRLKPNRCLLAKLIKMNSRQGLLLYWEDIKCNNRTPDRIVDDATDAIRNISDPALLPELLEMVEVRFSPGFKDGNFHSLSTSLFYALVACGKTEYDSVHTCMTALKENAAGSFGLVGFCSNVLNRLEKEREEGLARLWTLEEVKQELATIQ